MKIYAARIKQLRMERGLSQDQLAALLGISRSAVGMYETGKREPDLETCEAIADIFNIDMDYLTGRSDTEKTHLTITDTDPRLDELTRNARQLNAQGLQKLVDLSDDLVASGKYERKLMNQESADEYRNQVHAKETKNV